MHTPARLVVWLALLAPAAARAQTEQELPEAQWGKLPASSAGQLFWLDARWHECFGDKVLLWKSESARGFLIIKPATPLHDKLTKNKDWVGTPLVTGKSTVRVYGQAVASGNGCVLDVKKVVKQFDDEEVLRGKLALAADPDAIAALVREALALAERWADDDLRKLANEMVKRELAARRGSLKPGDTAAAEALGQRMLDVGDKPGAILVLGEAERTAGGTAKDRLRARLNGLGAVETSAAWMPRDDWRRKEGFVQRGDVWVHRERVELEDVRAAELKTQGGNQVVLVRGNGHALLKDAESGKLSRGQTPAEVHLAAGLPLTAARLDAPDALRQPAKWTQWILADGRRVYFLNAEVIAVRAAKEPWPE